MDPLLDNIAGRVQVLEHQVGNGNDEKDLRVQGQMEHLQRMLHDALERLHALESIGTSGDARDGMGLPLTPVHVSSSPLAGHEPSMTRLPVPRIPQPTSNVFGMPCGLPDPPLSHIDVFPMGPILGPKSDLDALFEQARRFGFSLVRTGGGVPFSQGKDTPPPHR